MTLFQNFLESIRGIVPQTKIVDKDGVPVTEANITDLKKSELVEHISLLEEDKVLQKSVLNNLDNFKESFSPEFFDEAETTTLTKIVAIDDAIIKARKELSNLKVRFADAIIFNNKGEILFLRRKNDSPFAPGVLGLPGGHIDPGEDTETAAKRELMEETNLEAKNCTLYGTLKTNDIEISYYSIEVEEKDLIILDASEHSNLEWKLLQDLDENDSIPGLKDKLEQMMQPYKQAVKILKKAFDQDKISEDRYLEALAKAKGPAQIGEIREWSGQKMKKEAQGWVPVKSDKGGKEEEQKKAGGKRDDKEKKPGAGKQEGEKPEKTPEQLSMYAKETDSDTLRETAEDPNAEPALQQAAAAELEGRGEKPSIKQRLKEKAKDWHKKQIEVYQSGALDAGSEDRKDLSSFLKKKKDGMITALKEEVHELKATGLGLKKFFSGNKSDITSHEAKAIKTTAIHLGIVVGSMALTGGLGHAVAGKGIALKLAGLSKGVVSHYFEHAGLTRLGHVLAFAKAEGGELSDEELDKVLGELIDNLLDYIENGNISEDEWMDIGDESQGDFAMLADQEQEEGDEDGEEKSKKEEDK